jgi:hypothetical protein
MDCIGGVMVSVLASNVVDHGFEPWSSQTKDCEIGIGWIWPLNKLAKLQNKHWYQSRTSIAFYLMYFKLKEILGLTFPWKWFFFSVRAWFPDVTCLGSKGTRHDLYKVQNSFLEFFFISCLYMGVANHYIFNFEHYFFLFQYI